MADDRVTRSLSTTSSYFDAHLTEGDRRSLTQHLDELREALAAVRREMPEVQASGDLVDRTLPVDAMIHAAALEARINDLELMLAEPDSGIDSAPGRIGIGSRVSLRFNGNKRAESFVVAPLGADRGDGTVITPASPLGRAVLGHACGDHVEFRRPDGKFQTVHIDAVD